MVRAKSTGNGLSRKSIQRLLLVEDNPGDARLLREMLNEPGSNKIELTHVQSMSDAEKHLAGHAVDIILLDLGLADVQGAAAVRRAHAAASRVALVVVTGLDDESLAAEVLHEGAQEYLVKGQLQTRGLRRALRYAIERKSMELERQSMEEALSQSEERARELLENATGAIYISSTDGTVVQVNRAAEKLQGRQRSEIVGRPVLEVIAPEERERTGRSFENILSEGNLAEFETLSLRADGTKVPIEMSAALVEVRGERFVHATVHDVSQRKALEEQLRHAQKMEAVGRLAGGIAHDFNNLLTVILATGEILLLHLADQDAMRRDIGDLQKAAELGSALTERLLAFSRKQVLKPLVLDPGEVLAGMTAMIGGLLGEKISLSCFVAPDSGKVLLDRGQLEQVIMNLALNARDAMPTGGRLSFKLEAVQRDENYVDLHLRARIGPFVRITVEDSGIGMNAEIRSHIFEPFFTTKESGRGTGLGLATVYGIVKTAGGDVWVYSEPGHGTTFKIFLPRVEASEYREPVAPESATTAAGSGARTILLLEDDDIIRRMEEEYLTFKGYRVIAARDGDEMLRLAVLQSDRIDLLVTDIVVPGKNGREVAEALRRDNASLRVIFMSGYTDDAEIVRGLLADGMEFLQKPFGLESLARRIGEILARPLAG